MPINRLALVFFWSCFAHAIVVIPAPYNPDDVHLAQIGNVTLLVYNPAPVILLDQHFASTGSFVAIVPPGTQL